MELRKRGNKTTENEANKKVKRESNSVKNSKESNISSKKSKPSIGKLSSCKTTSKHNDIEAPSKKKKILKKEEPSPSTKNTPNEVKEDNHANENMIKEFPVVNKDIKKPGGKKKPKLEDIPVCRPQKYESLGKGPCAPPYTGKKYVGCHVSAGGGLWNCFENGEKCNAKSIALFLRNQRTWNHGKPLDETSINKWKQAMKDYPHHLILPHGSYLMNLGSPNEENLEKSRQFFIQELKRCEKLGIPHYNFHPGSTLGLVSREQCCSLIAESINIAQAQTSNTICVIENMSKQGNTVGGDFHEIRLIIEGVEDKTRIGVCIDTCHAHAAGYDLGTEEGFKEMLEDFEKIIGWQFLRGLHLNDSKGKVGDHKDRHENIGKGYIGINGFKRIMNCHRFNDVPIILETPFIDEENYAKEIKLLESLIVED